VANDFTTRLLVRIRTLREAQDLSQEAFAEHAGLNTSITKPLRPARKPKFQLPTLIKISEALVLEPWQLLNFDVEPPILAEEQSKYGAKPNSTKATVKPPKRRSSPKRA
jgi:transcriptional regulator with XRE-family HTH domain